MTGFHLSSDVVVARADRHESIIMLEALPPFQSDVLGVQLVKSHRLSPYRDNPFYQVFRFRFKCITLPGRDFQNEYF